MRIVMLRLDDKLYEELERRARAEGYLTVAEYVRALIMKVLGYGVGESEREVPEEHSKRVASIAEKIIAIVERRLQDRINPFTSKVDEVNRRVAEIIERLEVLEDKIKEIESRLHREKEYPEEERERRERKKSAMEILREQRVIFESDIAKRIRDRDTFFLRLERSGAKVIAAKDERIAVDPYFWRDFVKKVESINTNNDEEIRQILDPIEYKLFDKLRESALIYFDASSRKWSFLID